VGEKLGATPILLHTQRNATRERIVMTEDLQSTRLSKSVLHDIIKSVITYYPLQIVEICRHTHIKRSNLLSGKTWILKDSRQEQINVKYRQADVVWFHEDKDHNQFFVVHEIKTGGFDIVDIHRKYHTGMNVQIWVWAFKRHFPKGKIPITMKIIAIEDITDFILTVENASIHILKRESNV
jgi:hypothetical protein